MTRMVMEVDPGKRAGMFELSDDDCTLIAEAIRERARVMWESGEYGPSAVQILLQKYGELAGAFGGKPWRPGQAPTPARGAH